MATYTITNIDPRLTVIKAGVATDDVITNNTGAALEICTAATVTSGDVKTMTYDETVTTILPGDSYTVVAANDADDFYAIGTADGVTTTIPGIVIS